jgi:ATP-binding cassette, subfamily B, bacterial
VEGYLEKKKSLNKETLSIYWRLVRKYWPLWSLCGFGVFVAIGGGVATPILYKELFDTLADTYSAGKGASALQSIEWSIWKIGILLAITWFSWRVAMWAVTKFESLAMKDTTDASFAYLQNHSARFFADTFAGALVKRVGRFTAGLEHIADQVFLQLGQTILMVCLVLGVLFWHNRTLGTIFALWTIVLTTFNFLFSKYKLQYDLKRAELDTKVTARLADTISNAINLKLFASTKREIEEFEKVTEEHHRARYKTWMMAWAYDSVQGFSVRALELGMLIVAIRFWWSGTITIGDLVMFRSYLSQLANEVSQLGRNVRMIYEALADANEMTEILIKPHEILDSAGAATLEVTHGEVEFRSVQFSYNDGKKLVLQDFNLKTGAGEKVGIVGPSGGGKSTILKVLTRLYDLQGGNILIDHQDIALVTQESLHRNIAFVPQDPALFHRSLMENIRYSRPEATDEEVVEAAKLAHCHEFITSFPLGYNTLVGERGIKLSGGERQRVAIARAILMEAPILILDEATSSLDSESEMYIQDSLSKLMPGRTVIAVAHRLSTIQKMDRIVVVKGGRIVEEGQHELLIKEKGLYQKLWNLQSDASTTIQ